MVHISSRPWRRTTAALAAAAALALALTACTGGGSSESNSSASGAAQADVPLSVSIVVAPNSFDPAQLSDGQQAFVWASIFDTLLVRENGTGDIKPNAAESWEYNEDGTQLTLKIRSGMTFSSGDPVNAEAVRATMQRNADTPGLMQGKFAHVTSVDAPDDSTVVIEFDAFDPAFLPYLAQGAGAIGDPATLDSDRTATDPIGSGAYTLDTAASVPGTSYTLKRRDDYWNLDAYPFPTVKVFVLQDPTASFNALQSNQVNAAQVRAQMLGPIESDTTYTLKDVQAQAVMGLNILDRAGAKFPELGDERVRQAISMAIDREGIIKSLLGGAGEPAQQVFSPLGTVYDKSLNDTYEYDVDAAKALLAEAGYPDGFTLRIPSTFVTTSFEPTLTEQLGAIGIRLEWVAVPPQQAQSVTQSGEYGISFQVLGFSSDQAIASDFFGQGFNNPTKFTDPTLDELFEKINGTVNFDDALPYYQELNKYTIEQSFIVPIVYTNTTWVTRDGVVMLDNGANGFPNVRLFGFEG